MADGRRLRRARPVEGRVPRPPGTPASRPHGERLATSRLYSLRTRRGAETTTEPLRCPGFGLTPGEAGTPVASDSRVHPSARCLTTRATKADAHPAPPFRRLDGGRDVPGDGAGRRAAVSRQARRGHEAAQDGG